MKQPTAYSNLFFGYTGTAVINMVTKKDDEDRIDRTLLAPFKTTIEHSATGMFFARSAAIITAPLIYAVLTPIFLVTAIFNLLKLPIDLCCKNSKEATDSRKWAWALLTWTPVLLLAAVISPLVEIIDFVGALFNTGFGSSEANAKNNQNNSGVENNKYNNNHNSINNIKYEAISTTTTRIMTTK